MTGVDVLVRDDTRVAVLEYDGNTLPFEDSSFDAVMFVDVIHHTDDPDRMLAEAARVAGELVVVKDHVTDGVLAGRTLRLMDWVGNERHGVRLPYNYLTEAEWREMFRALDLDVLTWDTNLALYPAPLSLVFERRLQVLATLGRK